MPSPSGPPTRYQCISMYTCFRDAFVLDHRLWALKPNPRWYLDFGWQRVASEEAKGKIDKQAGQSAILSIDLDLYIQIE